MEDFNRLFQAFSSLKVGVIGDLMLDTYLWGKVERISPEAPVPVVTLKKKEYRIGGAGNVALNCQSLGASVSLLSVTGNDTEATILKELLEANHINTSLLITSNERITTNKIRVISRNQQMMRLDSEISKDLIERDENLLLEKISNFLSIEKPDVIIFEDYNKGVLTEKIIRSAIQLCVESGIVTTVDPKRKKFFSYKGVTIFKPNLKEVREGLNILIEDIDKSSLEEIHASLVAKLAHQVSFITLSEKGVFCQAEEKGSIITSHIRNIADVSGAGDTVIAVASLVYASTKNVQLMAEIANIAGGLVCEEVGTAVINKEKLLKECELLLG
jgi:D-glycero-beta-D-manno-heptose-7-phosphate kinase